MTRAGWRDVEALSVVIAEAVHKLELYQWLVPAPVARWDVLPAYFRIRLNQALSSGEVHTNRDHTAAAVWLRRADGHHDDPDHHHRQLATATGGWADRFYTCDAVRATHHPAGIRHDYLTVLAVQSAWQRDGIGSALLAAYHQRVDRDDIRLPTYLQATDPAARRLLLRHGYRDHGPPIHLPEGPALTPMWRQPTTPFPSSEQPA